jgi:hypothetical protein
VSKKGGPCHYSAFCFITPSSLSKDRLQVDRDVLPKGGRGRGVATLPTTTTTTTSWTETSLISPYLGHDNLNGGDDNPVPVLYLPRVFRMPHRQLTVKYYVNGNQYCTRVNFFPSMESTGPAPSDMLPIVEIAWISISAVSYLEDCLYTYMPCVFLMATAMFLAVYSCKGHALPLYESLSRPVHVQPEPGPCSRVAIWCLDCFAFLIATTTYCSVLLTGCFVIYLFSPRKQ